MVFTLKTFADPKEVLVMALIIEIRRDGGWVRACGFSRSTSPGTFSNRARGVREILFVEIGRGYAAIQSIKNADEILIPGLRVLHEANNLQPVALLRHGEEAEMWLQTDNMREPRLCRLRYEDPNIN